MPRGASLGEAQLKNGWGGDRPDTFGHAPVRSRCRDSGAAGPPREPADRGGRRSWWRAHGLVTRDRVRSLQFTKPLIVATPEAHGGRRAWRRSGRRARVGARGNVGLATPSDSSIAPPPAAPARVADPPTYLTGSDVMRYSKSSHEVGRCRGARRARRGCYSVAVDPIWRGSRSAFPPASCLRTTRGSKRQPNHPPLSLFFPSPRSR